LAITGIAIVCAVDSGGAQVGEPQRHTVDSDGQPMAGWEKGVAEPAAIVLLLHGRTWSTLPDFDLQVPGEQLSSMDGFVALGYTTYGLDMRGYGETPRDETGWNTPHQAARDLAAALRWVRRENPGLPVYLFGWSLGSMVSQLTAQRSPELIDRLVLFGYPNRPGFERPVDEPDGPPPARPTTAEAAASDFTTEGSISQPAIDAYVAAALQADPVRSDWTRQHEWNQLDAAKVTVPTLLIHGEFDPLTPLEAQSTFFNGLATSDKAWVVVPGGDHAAFLEAPRPYFIAIVSAFLLRGLPF
jgi:pimeloyl-ACP methyl ester carboxylesterase